jgi:hypothetical protein
MARINVDSLTPDEHGMYQRIYRSISSQDERLYSLARGNSADIVLHCISVLSDIEALITEINANRTMRKRNILNFSVRDESSIDIYNMQRTNTLLGHAINRGYADVVLVLLRNGASFTNVGSGISDYIAEYPLANRARLNFGKRNKGNPYQVLLKESSPMPWVSPNKTEECLRALLEYAKESGHQSRFLQLLFSTNIKQDYSPMHRILYNGMVDLADAVFQLLVEDIPYDPKHEFYRGLDYTSKKNETIYDIIVKNKIDLVHLPEQLQGKLVTTAAPSVAKKQFTLSLDETNVVGLTEYYKVDSVKPEKLMQVVFEAVSIPQQTVVDPTQTNDWIMLRRVANVTNGDATRDVRLFLREQKKQLKLDYRCKIVDGNAPVYSWRLLKYQDDVYVLANANDKFVCSNTGSSLTCDRYLEHACRFKVVWQDSNAN